MTPELLEQLTPEQRKMWKRCENATPGPWCFSRIYTSLRAAKRSGLVECNLTHEICHTPSYAGWDPDFISQSRTDLPAVLLELAQAKRELADCTARHQKSNAVLEYERQGRNRAQYELEVVRRDFVQSVERQKRHDAELASALKQMRKMNAELEEALTDTARLEFMLAVNVDGPITREDIDEAMKNENDQQ